jgi:hypothetical protein
MLDQWNKAWDKDTVTLTPLPKHLARRGLEGKSLKDKDLMRRAIGKCIIGTEQHYDNLLKTLSEWGYCLEIPTDFQLS